VTATNARAFLEPDNFGHAESFALAVSRLLPMSVDAPLLAHSLVAAHSDRVSAFAARYAEMARRVSATGPDSPESSNAQLEIMRMISVWNRLDREAELDDMVELVGDVRVTTQRGLQRALHYTDLLDDDERDQVEPILRSSLEVLAPMPRAFIRILQRCIARLHRLEELQAPTILLANEGRLISRALSNWKTPPPLWEGPVDWTNGCTRLLWFGTKAMTIAEPSGRRGADLGLGRTRAVDELLGLADDVYDRLLDPMHAGPDGPPLESVEPRTGAYPLVPVRRFHDLGPAFLEVRDHDEMVGPIGWADGDELVRLAEGYVDLARRHPSHERSLARVATNLRTAHDAQHAVLGCLELLTYESDGARRWLVDQYDEDDETR
jgi:hypothetical protein